MSIKINHTFKTKWIRKQMTSTSSQILEKLERRRKYWPSEIQFVMLSEALRDINKNIVFANYIPIRLVTLIETSFRVSIKEIIDRKIEFKKRALSYISKIPNKQISELLFHVEQDSFTIGEIVSNILPCSKIDDIISPIEFIYGSEFKEELSQSRERWLEDEGKFAEPFITDLNVTLASLSRLFEIRHILVHEMPLQDPCEIEEFENFFNHALNFVKALEWLVTYKTVGVVPRTQSMMNRISGEKAQKILIELTAKYGEPAPMPEELKKFDQHTVWHWFAHLAADAASGLSLGSPFSGSMAPFIYSHELARLNEWRLKDLESQPPSFSSKVKQSK